MGNVMTKSSDLKKRLKAVGVTTCIASYVDIRGVSKSKFVPMKHFDQMMKGSEMFTGAHSNMSLAVKKSGKNLFKDDKDPLSKAVFGEAMFDSWLAYQREEWPTHLNHVSDRERSRDLRVF